MLVDLFRRRRPLRADGYRRAAAVTIRWASPADEPSLAILAEIDEAPVPPAPLLVGVVDDELWVAASLSTGATICDPFRPSAEVAALVLERGRQLTVPDLGETRRRVLRLPRRWPATQPFRRPSPAARVASDGLSRPR